MKRMNWIKRKDTKERTRKLAAIAIGACLALGTAAPQAAFAADLPEEAVEEAATGEGALPEEAVSQAEAVETEPADAVVVEDETVAEEPQADLENEVEETADEEAATVESEPETDEIADDETESVSNDAKAEMVDTDEVSEEADALNDESVVDRGPAGPDATWTLTSDGTLTVSGTGKIYDRSGTYTLWRKHFSDVKKAVIGEGITIIGKDAFGNPGGEDLNSGCTNMVSVSLPSTLTQIKEEAFYYCTSLESITIPGNVESIGKCAFTSCTKLTNVTLEEGVGSIGECAFSSNYYFFSFDGSVMRTEYGGASSSASGITSISIPASVKSIGYGAFAGCKDLNEVTLHEGTTDIKDYAFENCGAITSIKIPNSVTYLGSKTFNGCKKLASVELGSGITAIAGGLFGGCALTSVSIPNGVLSIGGSAFDECAELTSVSIPEGVTSIGGSAFYKCVKLTAIDVPSTVSKLGDSCFYGCSSLGSVSVKGSVSEIPDNCFEGCTPLKRFIVPDGVTRIGEEAFYKTNINYIGLPASLTRIAYDAFYDCQNLETADYAGSQNRWKTMVSVGSGNELLTKVLHCALSSASIKDASVTLPQSSYTYTGSRIRPVPTVMLNGNVLKESDGYTVTYTNNISVGTATVTVKGIGDYYDTASTTFNIVKAASNVLVTRVTLNKSTASVVKGKTVKLTATIAPSNATNRTVSWTSSNRSIATVSSTGVVTGVKAGKVTITATAADGSNQKASCAVTVSAAASKAKTVAVKGVKLSKKTASIKKGKKVTLKATITPTNATNKGLTWKTSNKKVATVTSKGVVKGVKKGKATITVTTKDGKKKATCKVTVK